MDSTHSSRRNADGRREGSSRHDRSSYSRRERSRSPQDDYMRRERRRSRDRDASPRAHRSRNDRAPSPASGNQRHERARSHSSDRSVDDRREREYRHKHRRTRTSRSPLRSHARRRSDSPPAKRRRRSLSNSRSPPTQRSRKPLPSQNASFRGDVQPAGGDDAPPEKQKPNYKPTGLLAREANTVAGTKTVLKYHEPAEARKPSPKQQWRMYVFKKNDLLDTVHLHERSAWLIGRDQQVTDFLVEHPSVSKQHAVVQFRYITTTNEFGDREGKVKPYLIDLGSANGTRLNGAKIEPSRYVELVDTDVVAFGDSEREYVMMLPAPDK